MRDHVDEETYLEIVRNKILVDIQVCWIFLVVVYLSGLFGLSLFPFQIHSNSSPLLSPFLFQKNREMIFCTQIFTSNILNEKSGDESPFLEFIERVCSQKCDKLVLLITFFFFFFFLNFPLLPFLFLGMVTLHNFALGCGGFGIRNFLTLFLSIEVSKAMNDLEVAREQVFFFFVYSFVPFVH